MSDENLSFNNITDDLLEKLSHKVDDFIIGTCEKNRISVNAISGIVLGRLYIIHKELGNTQMFLDLMSHAVTDVLSDSGVTLQ